MVERRYRKVPLPKDSQSCFTLLGRRTRLGSQPFRLCPPRWWSRQGSVSARRRKKRPGRQSTRKAQLLLCRRYRPPSCFGLVTFWPLLFSAIRTTALPKPSARCSSAPAQLRRAGPGVGFGFQGARVHRLVVGCFQPRFLFDLGGPCLFDFLSVPQATRPSTRTAIPPSMPTATTRVVQLPSTGPKIGTPATRTRPETTTARQSRSRRAGARTPPTCATTPRRLSPRAPATRSSRAGARPFCTALRCALQSCAAGCLFAPFAPVASPPTH